MRTYIYPILLTLVLIQFADVLYANNHDYREIVELSGKWKFSIGDKAEWASVDFDDSDWEKIWVPARWENEGYFGYDGYAWYRRQVKVNELPSGYPIFLSLGYIDDVNEVYINGELIGKTGDFPPYYETAFNARRFYQIPNGVLNAHGVNTIAVRVFDAGGEGGIVHGDIAIVSDFSAIPVDFDLQGKWSFKLSNIDVEKNANIDISMWNKISVPDIWENQGYKNYDGYATYAIRFTLNNQFVNDDMVLVLGKIDDVDQVYLNGQLVGQMSELKHRVANEYRDAYRQMRGYYLKPGALNHNGENVLFVKVLDTGGVGGIYEGSVGLITQTNYISYWRARSRR